MFESSKINAKSTWKEMTPGGTIYDAGNSVDFKTGDWRSQKPVFIRENCKQCLHCVRSCPDSAIPVNAEGQREDFNYDYCKGCGVCSKACPFHAIEMQ